MDNINLHALKDNIGDAFKSLIKSGRPDIKDEDNKDLIPLLYVDLYENNYMLKQAIDDNHVLFKGRKGTGKSTIFLQAENEIKDIKSKIAIYINLQSCYEEIKTANSDQTNNQLTKYKTYCNFFTQVVYSMKESFRKKVSDSELNELFDKIKEGEYIDADFQKSLTITASQERDSNMSGKIETINGITKVGIEATKAKKEKSEIRQELHELRILSINEILRKIKELLSKHNINRVYLFLDDFSELNRDNQKIIIDSLIAPIIASYNDVFTIKLAAYPYRFYLGNIDSSKIVIHSLDFYNVYELSAQNYTQVEQLSLKYIRRTLEKRLEVFTKQQIQLEEIFDISRESLDEYLKTLFYASSGIPRSLGYILTYCYLSSINQGKPITIENINLAAKKYYKENILPDFYNDTRFKQSFYDDKNILDQITQKALMDRLIKKAISIKSNIIEEYKKKKCKKIFTDTIEQYRKTTVIWLPTSHFNIDIDLEYILQTLELYFIVTKFNEGSSRVRGRRVSHFGLNYGLCLDNSIDYGRPEFRRTYDYWRQEEFDYTEFIPSVLQNLEIPVCQNCGYKYEDEEEYNVYKKFNRCLKCGVENTVIKENKFRDALQKDIETWKEISLPDTYIDILRLLYNYREKSLTAFEIGSELDRHHLSITRSMKKLISMEYVTYKIIERRYYKIKDEAILVFFEN